MGIALALSTTTALMAQPAVAPTIREVMFAGLGRTPESVAREVAGLTAGDLADTPSLDSALERLLRSRRFLTVDYRLEPVDDGVRVVFDVRERTVVTAIRFEGNSELRDARLRPLVTHPLNVAVDWLAVRDGREAITALYRQSGFGDVEVSYDQAQVMRSGILVYTIEEGSRVRIRSIRFEGNDSIPPERLKKHVDTKKAFWFLRPGAFDRDRAESDVAALQSFYRDEGFLDARVRYETEFSEGGKDMGVVFLVEEGSRYTIESIEFVGVTVFSPEELLAAMTSRVGSTVKRRQVEADRRAVLLRYGQLGYIYATVGLARVFSDTPGLVRITMAMEEGEPYRVGKVIVQGNARTKDKVVRRALNLYPPDDLFDMTEAREAEQRLLQTRVFGSARVYPKGDEPGVRDVVMDVTEAEQAGNVIFQVGVTSNSGLIGSIVIDLQNFDLYDRPKSWKEFYKRRAFFGGGQHMRLELQPGTQVGRYRLDFTEPYLFDKPIRFDTSLFVFGRGRDGWTERRGGATISFGQRFDRGRLRGWSGELTVRIEDVNIDDIDLFTSREVRDDEGSNLITSLRGSLVRDRRDNRFVPTSGDRLRLGYEQTGVFGGDHTFGKLTAAYQWYKTLSVDLLDRKRVLTLKAEGGLIVGNAPVFERFFAGGTGSLRGFEFRGVGERDGLDQTNVGGDVLLLLGSEYSFPLFGDNIRGHTFLDVGMAGSDGLRASLGVGARFSINLFGRPVPLEVNIAIPFLTESEDDTRVFSFLIGRTF